VIAEVEWFAEVVETLLMTLLILMLRVCANFPVVFSIYKTNLVGIVKF